MPQKQNSKAESNVNDTPKPYSQSIGNRVDIASTTLEAIEKGSFNLGGRTYDLRIATNLSKDGTKFYNADDEVLSSWASSQAGTAVPEASTTTKDTTESSAVANNAKAETTIQIVLESVLEASRNLFHFVETHSHLSNSSSSPAPPTPTAAHPLVGVLNFASAKNPGGGFISGAQAQEESLARSSTLYPPLLTSSAQNFYDSHRKDPHKGIYSHAMIYVPRVLLFRNDTGEWMRPVPVEILVSAAVNAGVVRRERGISDSTEEAIARVMYERMARVLRLFEMQGVKNIVLGSFGSGVFRNNVSTVASNWADLLVGEEAHFKLSFDRVVFAIKDEMTFEVFKEAFERRRIQITG